MKNFAYVLMFVMSMATVWGSHSIINEGDTLPIVVSQPHRMSFITTIGTVSVEDDSTGAWFVIVNFVKHRKLHYQKGTKLIPGGLEDDLTLTVHQTQKQFLQALLRAGIAVQSWEQDDVAELPD